MEIRGYKKNTNLPVVEQEYVDVGSDAFYIIAYRDPSAFLKRDFIIEAAGGVVLQEGTDYEFDSIDEFYSDSAYENEDVASAIRIINPVYQSGSLFISYRWVADYASAEMFNRFDRGLDQMIDSIVTDENGAVVVDNAGNVVSSGENYPGYRKEL